MVYSHLILTRRFAVRGEPKLSRPKRRLSAKVQMVLVDMDEECDTHLLDLSCIFVTSVKLSTLPSRPYSNNCNITFDVECFLIPLCSVIRTRSCVISWLPHTYEVLLVRVNKFQFFSSRSNVSNRPRTKSRSWKLKRFRSDGHSSSRYPCLQVRLGRDRLEVELHDQDLNPPLCGPENRSSNTYRIIHFLVMLEEHIHLL